ncbi:MAG: hypothetical protein ACR2OZ_08445 [Verrucomicrobiales bacterium]
MRPQQFIHFNVQARVCAAGFVKEAVAFAARQFDCLVKHELGALFGVSTHPLKTMLINQHAYFRREKDQKKPHRDMTDNCGRCRVSSLKSTLVRGATPQAVINITDDQVRVTPCYHGIEKHH